MVFLKYVSTNSDFFDFTSLEVVYDYNEIENESPYNLEPINIQIDNTFIALQKYTTIYALPSNIQNKLYISKMILDETFDRLSNYSKINNIDNNASAYVFKISLPIANILNDINIIKIRSYLFPPSNVNTSNLYSINCKVSNYKYIIDNAEKEINTRKIFLINEELLEGKITSIDLKLDSTINTIMPKIEFNLNKIDNNNGTIFKIRPEHYLYLVFKQISVSRMDESKYNIQSIINIPINSINAFIESLFKDITNEYKFFIRATKRINKVIYPRTSVPIIGPKKYSGRYF